MMYTYPSTSSEESIAQRIFPPEISLSIPLIPKYLKEFAKSHMSLYLNTSVQTQPRSSTHLAKPCYTLSHHLYHPHGGTICRIRYVIFIVRLNTILLPYLVSRFQIKTIPLETKKPLFTSMEYSSMVLTH